jgi:L-alanine-DL-glutamate epimerase-like enolase superfamily enzyme
MLDAAAPGDAHGGPGDLPPTTHAARARRARALAQRLAALPLRVERASCRVAPAAVPSYPDGPRPSSTLVLDGAGHTGRGEHVGWTGEAHAEFAARAGALPLADCATVGHASALAHERLSVACDRAALETAAIDLALRQAATDLFALCGVTPSPVRYVLSFERVADPAARARTELAPNPGLELKIDADPAWSDAALASLAALGGVAVLDFKRSGARPDHLRAHRLLPGALLEDAPRGTEPWPASLRARLALDAAITCAADVAALDDLPAAVNVKPARVGGVLEALAVIAACAARGIDVYVGGMFEVGVGRVLAQTLASLFSPRGPNDVAPIALVGRPAPRPDRLVVVPPPGGGLAS